mgnify:CR=1 FL=1
MHRLVKQQRARIVHEGASEEHAARLAARHGHDVLICKLRHTQHLHSVKRLRMRALIRVDVTRKSERAEQTAFHDIHSR